MANTSLKFGNGNWAIKEDSALAYSDQYDNFKPLPFDFSRAGSGTIVNKEGLIESVNSGIPRIDFSDSADGALLLEPQSTNLIEYSEDFSQWQRVNISTELSNTLSPDGLSFMTKATFSSAGVNSYVRQNRSMNSGSITFSCFVKKGLIDAFSSLRIVSIDNPVNVWFDLDNGTIASETGSPTNKSIVDYGNGIYRISVTTTSTSDLSFSAYIQSASIDGGTPTENATQFYWGGQAENLSYATSYIPTQGSTSTRIAESCSQTPPDGVIGQTEGCVYLELPEFIPQQGGVGAILSIHDGSNTNRIGIININSTQIQVYIIASSTIQVLYNFTPSYGVNKIALSYANNDVAIAVNGAIMDTYTSATIPTTSEIALNSYGFVNVPANSPISQTKLYNTRLSNSELQELTTI